MIFFAGDVSSTMALALTLPPAVAGYEAVLLLS